jgi:hypothetical protein
VASIFIVKRAIGFQPMVAVFRDIDRHSDRIGKSEALLYIEQKIASLVSIRLRR